MAESADYKRKYTMEPQEGARRLLIAIDRSEHSVYAFQWALDNIVRPTDHLFILFALETNQWASLGTASSAAEVMQQVRDEEMASARDLLKAFGHTATEAKIPHTCELALGDPRTHICDFLEDKQCSLLIMGSRGMGALKRALVGSVSDYCVHNAKCPVLVVKQP